MIGLEISIIALLVSIVALILKIKSIEDEAHFKFLETLKYIETLNKNICNLHEKLDKKEHDTKNDI